MSDIEDVIHDMKKKGFLLKVERDMTDYLSCRIQFSKKRDRLWLGQPYLMKKMIRKFGSLISDLSKFKTPSTPGLGMRRPLPEDPDMSNKDKTLYRSGVRMLLYFVKHLRPDIANVTRELSKVMDRPTPNAIKELKRVIKFVVDTQEKGFNSIPVK